MAVSRIDEAGLNVTQYGNRNVIINGAFQVAQRGTSVTNTGAADFNTVDRFQYAVGSGGGSVAYTMSQSTEAPDGFANSFKLEVTTTDTLTGGENTLIRTRLEGQDVQRFNFGSSNAESVTLSFYVRSSETGTYGVQLMAGPSGNTTALQTYTVNSANTWEYKTLTFVGATGYTIPNDTSRGFDVNFMLDSGPDDLIAPYTFNDGQGGSFKAPTGQVNFSQTSGNTFHITGVQLEVGDTATPFEHRSYGEELQRCQRYFYRYGGNGRENLVGGSNTNTGYFAIQLPTTMRAAPTFSNGGGFTVNNFSSAGTPSDINGGLTSINSAEFQTVGGITYTLGNTVLMYETSTNSGNLKFDAEL